MRFWNIPIGRDETPIEKRLINCQESNGEKYRQGRECREVRLEKKSCDREEKGFEPISQKKLGWIDTL